MMDPWGRELFLICLLAAFCSGLAWVFEQALAIHRAPIDHGHQLNFSSRM